LQDFEAAIQFFWWKFYQRAVCQTRKNHKGHEEHKEKNPKKL
jgi:hypothetical protein